MNDFIQSTQLLAQAIGKIAEWAVPVIFGGIVGGAVLYALMGKEGE